MLEIELQIIKDAWEGKPKGILQILQEQGWIVKGRLQDYTMNGWKDAQGITVNNTSLKYLLGNC